MLNAELFVRESATIKDALKSLDRTAEKVLIVIDEKRGLLGALTDGDIRRYILQNKDLDSDISTVYNNRPIFIKKNDLRGDLAKALFLNHRIELVPVVDEHNCVVDLITWKDVFTAGTEAPRTICSLSVPVVIMAGGKGTRLDPFTKILPKPLIPIGDKPIAEVIIDQFKRYGIDKFFMTLNFKGKMIEAYFESMEKEYQISYIWEQEFLGTAGSLKLLDGKIKGTFIVSNCDILVKADYHDVLSFHRSQGAVLTVLSSIQHHRIPYGVIEYEAGGVITKIVEKPEFTVQINTGVYMLEDICLKHIPSAQSMDMPSLIQVLMREGKKVCMYPVNENDYVDIGQWEEFKKSTEKLSLFGR